MEFRRKDSFVEETDSECDDVAGLSSDSVKQYNVSHYVLLKYQ